MSMDSLPENQIELVTASVSLHVCVKSIEQRIDVLDIITVYSLKLNVFAAFDGLFQKHQQI